MLVIWRGSPAGCVYYVALLLYELKDAGVGDHIFYASSPSRCPGHSLYLLDNLLR
jgi:hypothetical protein